jgi:hypothetical protein
MAQNPSRLDRCGKAEPWELDRPIALAQVLLYVRRAARAECGRDDHMIRLRPELSPMQREAVAAYTARAAEDGLCRACSGRT